MSTLYIIIYPFQVLTSVSLFTAFVIAVCRYVNVIYNYISFQVLTSVSLFTAFVIAVCRYVNVRHPLMLLPNFIVYSTVIALSGARLVFLIFNYMFMSHTLCFDRESFHARRAASNERDKYIFDVLIHINAALTAVLSIAGLLVFMAIVMTLKSSNSNMEKFPEKRKI